MTRGEIANACLETLRDSTTSPGGWSRAEINNYIDEGYATVAEAIRSVVRTENLACPAGEHFIRLPEDIVQIAEVKDTTTGYPIYPKTYDYLDRRDVRWIQKTASRPWVYCAFGLEELILYPAFIQASTITMTSAIVPPAIPNDSTVPDIPEDYHWALVDFAVHMARIRDAYTPEHQDRAMETLRTFSKQLGQAQGWGDSRLGRLRFGVGWGPRLAVPTDTLSEGA